MAAPTAGALSEQRLARSLGYPRTWHVVRSLVPDPTTNAAAAAGGSSSAKLVQDRIFAGDPARNADLYYNHGAAFAAALNWVEGESTPYDDDGGQMLPRHALYTKGQEVEVLYDDGEWYHASIKKVTRYPDDIRYTVLYTEEDTYQNHVTEDEMRIPVPKPGKAKKSSSAASTKKRAAAGRGGGGGGASSYNADPAELELASEMGLPDGWTAKANKNSRYVFRSPDGKRRFQSKKTVYEFLGISSPPPKKKTKVSPKVQEEKEEEEDTPDVEEEDPPWRLDGHEFIGKRIRYRGDDGTEQTGMVSGWIAETDVDQAGDPGFVSETTGKPAALFHVEFDAVAGAGGELDFQDFEEYELLDCFDDAGEEKMEVENNDGEENTEDVETDAAAEAAAKAVEEEERAAAEAKRSEEEAAAKEAMAKEAEEERAAAKDESAAKQAEEARIAEEELAAADAKRLEEEAAAKEAMTKEDEERAAAEEERAAAEAKRLEEEAAAKASKEVAIAAVEAERDEESKAAAAAGVAAEDNAIEVAQEGDEKEEENKEVEKSAEARDGDKIKET